MSYIPNYKSEENEKHLNEIDKEFLRGYRFAVQDAKNFFNNLDCYDFGAIETAVLVRAAEQFEHWMTMSEAELECSIFESADYIGEDVEIVDVNKPLYANTKGSKNAHS